MEKTDNFFLIHNFNTIPTNLLQYCKDYIIYDCSSEQSVKDELRSMKLNMKEVENTGHNITTYFSYFDENYDNLPDIICLLKGNIIGRHCSMDFFEKVYDNKSFTFLYYDKECWNRFAKFTSENQKVVKEPSFLALENVFLEQNDSWYVNSPNHPKKYFNDVDDLLRFIYKDPMVPQYYMFSPGACYIVRREQILRHSRVFYRNLNKIMNYGMSPSFPSEAHQIERMLPIIFSSIGEVNDWLDDEEAFEKKLPECSAYIQYKYDNRPRRFKRLRKMLGLIK